MKGHLFWQGFFASIWKIPKQVIPLHQ